MSWKHFTKDEFTCRCGCGENLISPPFIDLLDHARTLAGIPFIINSGYRCEKHNKEINSKSNSAHVKGVAADIRVNTSFKRYLILMALIETGFNRIGIASNFIHADSSKELVQKVIWTY